jgi:DNA-binding protein HU-beta
VNRRELIAAVAAHSGTEAKVVDAVMRGFTDVVSATVSKGDPVVMSGFAKFAKIQTKARMGRNPATGEAIRIKASKKARITPLKGFKDMVLGATPAPKLAKPAPAKAPAAKAPAAKAPARKAPAKAAPAKAPARKAPAAKAPAAKAPARKAAPAKAAPAKAPARKAAPAKAAAKAPARKAPAKKR